MDLTPCTYTGPAEPTSADADREMDRQGWGKDGWRTSRAKTPAEQAQVAQDRAEARQEVTDRLAASYAEGLMRFNESLARLGKWSPPAGHDSWCFTQRDPALLAHGVVVARRKDHGQNDIGGGPRECNCRAGCGGTWGRHVARANGLKVPGPVKAPRQKRAPRATSSAATAPAAPPAPAIPADTLEGAGARVRALELDLDRARYDLRLMVKAAMADGLSGGEIARRVGLTRQRVHQLAQG